MKNCVCKAHVEENKQIIEVHLRKSSSSDRYYWTRNGLVLLLTKPYAPSPKSAFDHLRIDYPSAVLVNDNIAS